MNEQQVWIIPSNPADMAPLPALKLDETHFSDYNRRKELFSEPYEHLFLPTYDTYEECRMAIISLRTKTLEEANQYCRQLAASIEHIRTVPIATFPNVKREVREQGQQQEKAQAEKGKAKDQEVKTVKQQPHQS